MSRPRLTTTPGTAIALLALFFALGGSAFAVGERIQSPSVAQQRCANGAVRGFASVTGDPSKGKPGCGPEVGLADAVVTLVSNLAARGRRRIEFRDEWFDVVAIRRSDARQWSSCEPLPRS